MAITAFEQPIYVTRPFLPPLSRFSKGLEEIWENRWLTNHGPLVQRFEKLLADYYETENVCVFNNGTLALQIGLQALDISGDVITTPFTFVATTHSLYWNKIHPVFCDIDPYYYNLDPLKVVEKITPWTTAILAVHVFGNPCNLEALQEIAQKHKLMLIYDAAHAFGVQVANRSIAHFGDMSMFSFHATKLYHSFEGGMLAFKNSSLKKMLNYLKNFGFENELEVVMPGTNAKMNEIQALMGILMLEYVDQLIEKRKKLTGIYRERLNEIAGISFQKDIPGVRHNYAHMPVRINENEFGMSRDRLYDELKPYNIFTRRYFYPLVCDYPCYKSVQVSDPLTVARKVSSEILTLPLYSDLEADDVHKICDVLIYMRRKKG